MEITYHGTNSRNLEKLCCLINDNPHLFRQLVCEFYDKTSILLFLATQCARMYVKFWLSTRIAVSSRSFILSSHVRHFLKPTTATGWFLGWQTEKFSERQLIYEQFPRVNLYSRHSIVFAQLHLACANCHFTKIRSITETNLLCGLSTSPWQFFFVHSLLWNRRHLRILFKNQKCELALNLLRISMRSELFFVSSNGFKIAARLAR